MNKGDYVHYISPHGKKENGRVKSIVDDAAFVVFHCAGEWGNYENYTGQNCKLSDLRDGWVDANGNLMPEYCDHEYRPSAGKWQPVNQMDCIHCGHRINN